MEEENKSILVIPDVHGRRFWEDGVKTRKPGELMIFLGDYTDPYPHEGIKPDVVPGIIEEILEIPDTILLLGNHDFSYISRKAPKVRYDWDLERSVRINELFTQYHDRFKIGHIIKFGDRNLIFTHAGILKRTYEYWQDKDDVTPCDVVDSYNRMWLNREDLSEIHHASYWRGGDYLSGSIIWADIREHLDERDSTWNTGDYQIFGHTILIEGRLIKTPTFCMLDNQRPNRISWPDLSKEPEIEVL